MFGNVSLNPHKGEFRIDLKNVEIFTGNANPDFIIDVSGELLTKKIRKYTNSVENLMSPFIKDGVSKMGIDTVGDFKSTVIGFLMSINHKWPTVKRINELWLSQNDKYLRDELHKILNKTVYPADNQWELLRAVHTVNYNFTAPILKEKFFKNAEFIFSQLEKIQKQEQSHQQYIDLALHFRNQLNDFEERIFIVTNKFVEKFPMLIPVIGLEYYKDEDNKAKAMQEMGLTTVDFEDIKDFYIDTFEDLGDIFDLIVAFENLIVRSDFKLMDPNINKPIKTLEDYSKMQKKGKKLEFIDSLVVFKDLFMSKVDSKLRNAIGHRSYKYDVNTQKIVYSPSGKMDNDTLESIYLTEFTYECLQLFRSCLAIGELIYQTRKIICVIDGSSVRRFDEYFPGSSIKANKVTGSLKKDKNKDIFKKKKRDKSIQKKSRKNNRRKK
ncbi:metal-binding protein [Bacillus cereus]|nr:metal-binding protein [Bacillus cereus]KAB2412624.1 metal-binding protein [Bacillus cereus]KAB2436764.1 metal-binding protein [Bacillus cereus]KAB2468148.1 metal-binding protein [Bacillus cereus]